MSKKTILIKIVLPIAILMAGFVGMQTMVLSKKPPERQAPAVSGTLVETLPVTTTRHQVQVLATGTVQPQMTTTVTSQVSGRVVYMAPNLVVGGFFQKGQLLFAIDEADYRYAVEKSRAEVIRGEYQLAKMKSEARVARREWERLKLGGDAPPNPLVLYEPQLKDAQATLAAAKAELAQRELDVARTKIFAPFNCRIRAESVDLGQYVTAGQSVAEVAGTDAAEIIVPVPLKELRWIDVPGLKGGEGSAALVRLDVDGQDFEWPGRIVRSLGDVDPKGRMLRLVARVSDPYGLKRPADRSQHLNLAEGLFVEVILLGRRFDDVIAIPAASLRQGNTVWVMSPEKKLQIRKVDVMRREKDMVLISSGLAAGEQLIFTHLSGVAEGMRLRQSEDG
jgi:RND family efflux transporter MFP subunit